MTNYSPIVLFVYNRLFHTQKTVEALKKNYGAKNSELIIYSDAFKDVDGEKKVNDVRKYLKTIKGFKSVKIIERKENYGLAKSIISGVSEVVNKYGSIIVLEDDLVTSKYFLQYMNDALDVYHNENKVISIHGYVYPVKKQLPETFLMRGADCWGWATWKRGWRLFESDAIKLKKELIKKKLVNKFNMDGASKYMDMLDGFIDGKNNSWAVRWHASAILNDKLTLYPRKSLVKNIGLDNSGVNSSYDRSLVSEVSDSKINVIKLKIEEDNSSFLIIKDKLTSCDKNIFIKILNWIINRI